jgi:hypothetical protein
MAHPGFTPFNDIRVAQTFDSYPDNMRDKLLHLRQLVIDTANDIGIGELEETLKWGEPSYLTKQGSTIRVAWRKSSPNQYAIYFNCKTQLIDTFREIYPDTFHYEANRAIVFEAQDKLPVDALTHCITLSLRYHSIKHLPMLGV